MHRSISKTSRSSTLTCDVCKKSRKSQKLLVNIHRPRNGARRIMPHGSLGHTSACLCTTIPGQTKFARTSFSLIFSSSNRFCWLSIQLYFGVLCLITISRRATVCSFEVCFATFSAAWFIPEALDASRIRPRAAAAATPKTEDSTCPTGSHPSQDNAAPVIIPLIQEHRR